MRISSRKQDGFSLIELLIVIVIIGIIAAIAVPNFLASRRAANGASAVESMRVLYSSQATYQAGSGDGNFGQPIDLFNQELIDSALHDACSTDGVQRGPGDVLTPGAGGPFSYTQAKSGYAFIIDTTLKGDDFQARFAALARPAATTGIARTGDRCFFVDDSGVIRNSAAANIDATIASAPIN